MPSPGLPINLFGPPSVAEQEAAAHAAAVQQAAQDAAARQAAAAKAAADAAAKQAAQDAALQAQKMAVSSGAVNAVKDNSGTSPGGSMAPINGQSAQSILQAVMLAKMNLGSPAPDISTSSPGDLQQMRNQITATAASMGLSVSQFINMSVKPLSQYTDADWKKLAAQLSKIAGIDLGVATIKHYIKLMQTNPDSPELANLSPAMLKVLPAFYQLGTISPRVQDKVNSNYYVQVGTDFSSAQQPVYILRTDYNNIKTQSPNLADVLIHKGLKAYQAAANSANVAAQITQKQTIQNMRDAGVPAELIQTYIDHGVDAFNAAVIKYNADVETKNIQVKAKNIQSEKDWANANLATSEYQGLLNQQAQKARQIQIDDLQLLAPYGSLTEQQMKQIASATNVDDVKGMLANQSYNIQQYITDNPSQSSVDILKALEFDSQTIAAAQAYVNGVNAALPQVTKFLQGKKYGSLGLALDEAIQSAGFYVFPEASNAKWITNPEGGLIGGNVVYFDKNGKAMDDMAILQSKWNQLTPAQQKQVAGIWGNDKSKNNYFAEFNSIMNNIAAQGGKFTQMLFAPVTGITNPIAKTVIGEPTTFRDWAVAGATAALDFLMLGGGEFLSAGAMAGLSAGAGTIFTADTLANRKNMSGGDLALALSMDALMFAPLAIPAVKGITGEIKGVPNDADVQRATMDKIFETDREAFKKYATNNPNSPKNYANDFDIKYQKWTDDLQAYGDAEVRLAQAQKVITEVGFARTQGELALINQAKAVITDIEARLPELTDSVEKSGRDFIETQKGVLNADDIATIEKQLDNIPKQSINDIQGIAKQIVEPRNIETIQADIDAAKRELAAIDRNEPISNATLIQQTDYLNHLNRELYLAKLSETQILYINTMEANAL